MNVVFTINLERQKLKLRIAKQNFCNAYDDDNTDISKQSWETTVSYLGTKIQVKKIQSDHHSQNTQRFLNSICILISLKLENRAKRWRTARGFQIFLLAKHLLLFIGDVLCTHVTYMRIKNFTYYKKNCSVNTKKYFTQKLRCTPKLCESQKYYAVATKKIM